MSDTTSIHQLNKAIESLLTGAEGNFADADPAVAPLLAVAVELRRLPRRDFKEQLKSTLVPRFTAHDQVIAASAMASARAGTARTTRDSIATDVLPTLTGLNANWYPARRASFMASLGAHALMVALLVTSGIWAASLDKTGITTSIPMSDLSLYPLPPARDLTQGGGGGGDSSKAPASQGHPPRFSADQIVPPAIVVRREPPKLAVEPTVVGPPQLSFPQTAEMGNPFSSTATPSNGSGTTGGMGSGDRGGVGPGAGRGVGDGSLAGIGGGPYVVGRGVSAPRLLYDPEPEYSDEARKQTYQGMVLLRVVVGEDGHPREVSVAQSLGLGLDEKALEAVHTWRFEPGRLEGRPVAVVVNIQVNFRLY